MMLPHELDMPHRMRRLRDLYLAPAIWFTVVQEKAVKMPPDGSDFLEILAAGMRLQYAVAKKLSAAEDIALLERHARLGQQDKGGVEDAGEDAVRELSYRIAASYLLWPYYAATYYGYGGEARPNAERKAARDNLCRIQHLLYNNVRVTLDVLRRWFGVSTDGEVKKWVVGDIEGARRFWRPLELIAPKSAPDLCAVDMLAEHLLELVAARPLVRQAIETIQSLSLADPNDYKEEVCKAVRKAFEALHVAQMTVFYHPNPGRGVSKNLPLRELVHAAGESDPIPKDLIPFFESDRDVAKGFRHLATKIYSATDSGLYKNFFAHREKTIAPLERREVTKFISDGEMTNFFLTTEPPTENKMWPLWYKMTLRNIADRDDLPDWSDQWWWAEVNREELRQRLFPGRNGDLHLNDHMSAYWDAVAADPDPTFLSEIEIPEQRPSKATARFGYLMELLLRREEPETRTSFFFALAQTYEQTSRISNFVGGTFIGLEKPGIPFCKERFEAIAARMRALVMSVSNYTTAHVTKKKRQKEKEEKESFMTRTDSVVALLEGDGREDEDFNREGYLLFTTPAGGRTDHDKWGLSHENLKLVFNDPEHLIEPPADTNFGGPCSHTWKAIFYLGNPADRINTLGRFMSEWRPRGSLQRRDRSDRRVTCPTCFTSVVEYLLGPVASAMLANKIIVPEEFYLPSRPGVRFLIALCRFIVHIQFGAKLGTSVTNVEFINQGAVLSFDQSTLLDELTKQGYFNFNSKVRPPYSFEQTSGVLELLRNNKAFIPAEANTPWQKFLSDREHGQRLRVTPDPSHLTLRLEQRT